MNVAIGVGGNGRRRVNEVMKSGSTKTTEWRIDGREGEDGGQLGGREVLAVLAKGVEVPSGGGIAEETKIAKKTREKLVGLPAGDGNVDRTVGNGRLVNVG